MKKVQPYLAPVVTLITALLTLGHRVVRQVILPTLTRKGNLLQSLFLLFTELTELVISFVEAVARVPRTFQIPARLDNAWVFSRKYLRQGMLIAAWALFILSSLEWTSTRASCAEPTTVEQSASPKGEISQSQIIIPAGGNDLTLAITPPLPVHPLVHPPTTSTRRWLLLRTLRL